MCNGSHNSMLKVFFLYLKHNFNAQFRRSINSIDWFVQIHKQCLQAHQYCIKHYRKNSANVCKSSSKCTAIIESIKSTTLSLIGIHFELASNTFDRILYKWLCVECVGRIQNGCAIIAMQQYCQRNVHTKIFVICTTLSNETYSMNSTRSNKKKNKMRKMINQIRMCSWFLNDLIKMCMFVVCGLTTVNVMTIFCHWHRYLCSNCLCFVGVVCVCVCV